MATRHELSGFDLDPRAREVLREIVLQHIASGEAISSRTLARGGRFNLSPASLRNVMADLEDLGYLQQPHTSAGRVPTDRDEGDDELTASERDRLRQLQNELRALRPELRQYEREEERLDQKVDALDEPIDAAMRALVVKAIRNGLAERVR